ncbi:MAG: antitoxin VapB family protein [Candidatus Methanospirareceae archaeon]
MKQDDYVIIRVSKEVREELKRRGRKGETYNDVIKRLLEKLKKMEVKKDE